MSSISNLTLVPDFVAATLVTICGLVPHGFFDSFEYTETGNNLCHLSLEAAVTAFRTSAELKERCQLSRGVLSPKRGGDQKAAQEPPFLLVYARPKAANSAERITGVGAAILLNISNARAP
jgi:hypothetical protein